MKKLLIGSGAFIAGAIFVSGLVALAQNTSSGGTVSFAQDLHYGMTASADVTNLQQFLTAQGVYSGPITGNFFSLTENAVKAFQRKKGIAPVSGYFGPRSRRVANQLPSVSTGSSNQTSQGSISALKNMVSSLQLQLNNLFQSQSGPSSQTNQSSSISESSPTSQITTSTSGSAPQTFTTPGPSAVLTTSTLQITSISPSSGPLGTSITLHGSGFYGNATMVWMTSSTISGELWGGMVASDGLLTIPLSSPLTPAQCQYPPYTSHVCPLGATVQPGTYSIYITNQNGTSNSASFTVTPSAASY